MSHFTDIELKCRCCGELKLEHGFRDKLEQLRIVYGKPMVVNCAYRCVVHNKEVGGSKNSYHLKGMAIDVHCPDGRDRHKLVGLAIGLGWSVGVYKTFLHLDRRIDEGVEAVVFYG